ncbi:hypothetical protein BDZ89DRAFT_1065238, partial [Hymenopellis radicata]
MTVGWLGMITLMRIAGPTSLFLYGYITGDGRGLVGNWRIGTGEVGLHSYEGAFTMGCMDETPV